LFEGIFELMLFLACFILRLSNYSTVAFATLFGLKPFYIKAWLAVGDFA
jgi:hypothetical protein